MTAVPDSLVASLREFIDAKPHIFTEGLSDQEFAAVEARFGFRFPPDLRAFLALALPNTISFPDWRSDSEEELRLYLDGPADGICFDIEHNSFWFDEWGARPDDLAEALAVAREHVGAAPTLIPVYGHRYIPEEPGEVGNPILSVHQTDIIYYGSDLVDYLHTEFGRPGRMPGPPGPTPTVDRSIRFWTQLIEQEWGN